MRTADHHARASPAIERQLLLLARHFAAIPYRGLNRISALKTVPPISGNNFGDFACDTVWMARLARAGDLVRVPRVLYHKRYFPSSTHAKWEIWPKWQKGPAWVGHCLDMLAEAQTVASSIGERRLLIDAARGRLLGRHMEGINYRGVRDRSRIIQWGLRLAFEAGAAMRADIGPLWRPPPY